MRNGNLKLLEPLNRPSVADSVFDELHQQIITLRLAPGTKLSETEVARALGVSRQPVRDAFYRLSKLGFIVIRPQRATTVSTISERAVMRARFVRTALEMETVRVACERLSTDDHAALDALLGLQRSAMEARDPVAFHSLDDQFHREICERAGLAFAWEIIRENKAHMDRVRFLSLAFASQDAYGDHLQVMEAIRLRDPDLAIERMRRHLSRIRDQIVRIRNENAPFFAVESGPS